MQNNPVGTEWDDSDPRWREHTFLEYVADTAGKNGRLPLGGVQSAIFTPDQPEEFATLPDDSRTWGCATWIWTRIVSGSFLAV